MPLRTTIQHIADQLNLTPATGSRALSDHPRISTVQMGREAFKLLLQLIENNTKKILNQRKIIPEPIPFYRESSLRNRLADSGSIKNDKIIHNLFSNNLNTPV
jgi:DNA-binding LacI/PurR family transcriptional regulator